jgi:hypothetical protein
MFTRSTNCSISNGNHVDVSNTLEISGSNTDMNNLITITAATNKRHFYLDNANAKLILHYLKLVGGDVSGDNDYGGSIFISSGKLNIYSSIIYGNKAIAGGAIIAYGANDTNVIMNIYNSFISNNEAANAGGGIYLHQTISNIIDTTFNQNIAGSHGGAMSIFYSDATFKAIVISNNTAAYFGGGMYIMGKTNNDGPSNVNFTNVFIYKNKISSTDTNNSVGGDGFGGGGMYLVQNSNIIIRESSFISNTAKK